MAQKVKKISNPGSDNQLRPTTFIQQITQIILIFSENCQISIITIRLPMVLFLPLWNSQTNLNVRNSTTFTGLCSWTARTMIYSTRILWSLAVGPVRKRWAWWRFFWRRLRKVRFQVLWLLGMWIVCLWQMTINCRVFKLF